MDEDRHREMIAWVAREVMPHERNVRMWLSRSSVSQDDIDDVIQETYCRLASIPDLRAIDRPDAYFFSIARNLLTAQIRRRRIVPIETVAEIEALSPFDDRPSPERAAIGRIELERVYKIVQHLPDRCRRIFEMRKIEGISQKEIAERLGITESMVENEGAKGVRLILTALRRQDEDAMSTIEQISAPRTRR